jgi:hypothetical protein
MKRRRQLELRVVNSLAYSIGLYEQKRITLDSGVACVV